MIGRAFKGVHGLIQQATAMIGRAFKVVLYLLGFGDMILAYLEGYAYRTLNDHHPGAVSWTDAMIGLTAELITAISGLLS